MSSDLYAKVIVDIRNRSLSRTFDYLIPDELRGRVVPGSSVEVPFGHRELTGVVLKTSSRLEAGMTSDRLKPVHRLLDPEPVWGRHLLELAEWLKDFYATTWQASLQTVIPGPVLARLRDLLELKKPRSLRATGEAAMVEFPSSLAPTLNVEQQRAVAGILEASAAGRSVLLHGITGSGKTEVYLHAIEAILGRGQSAMVLVPEVSLTPQAVERYRSRLGDTVAVLHSGLTDKQRRQEWWKLRQGECRVALGTRSAVFAPLEQLGLIVIDEEHDNSYKQSGEPRYHARQVAAWRARQSGCAMVLGSATPSVESYHLAGTGYYRLYRLNNRAQHQPLPPVELIDMRAYRSHKGLISPPLLEALELRHQRGEQSVLLLNRRGFSSYLQCMVCGEVRECPDCSISLTFHKARSKLICHYCDRHEPPPDVCWNCGSPNFSYQGAGTERLQAELRKRLPDLRVARMDRDTTSKAGAHADILKRFEEGEYDVLVGTQMVAKGLDFPKVTLVGVVGGDGGLHLPDFRAGERTFALLTQVAGRAGRAELAGEVLVQAYQPDHACLKLAAAHDYQAFFERELELRRQLVYPPFCRLVRLGFSSKEESQAEAVARATARALGRQLAAEQILGPAPCPLHRLRGRYRWHLLLKGNRVQDLVRLSRNYLEVRKGPQDIRVFIDPDPQELM